MAPKKAAAASSAKKAEPSHPAYLDMIKEAIITLKERNGSSRQEIKKYILANYKLQAVPEAQFKSQVNRALSKGVDNGVLTRPKGPSGPVKLAKADSKAAAKPATTKKVKSETKPATKKAPAKKTATTTTKKTAAPAKKAAAPAKKAAAAKPKTKANTGKPRKPAAAPAVVEKKPVVLGTTKSGRVTKSSAPQTKKTPAKKTAAAKKATPKKSATPKKA